MKKSSYISMAVLVIAVCGGLFFYSPPLKETPSSKAGGVAGFAGKLRTLAARLKPGGFSLPANGISQADSPAVLLFQVRGKIARDGTGRLLLVSSDKKSKYILTGGKTAELGKNVDRELDILGKIIPSSPETLNGERITCNIDVIGWGSNLIFSDTGRPLNEELLKEIQRRVEKKRELYLEVCRKFNKTGVFDVVKGKVSEEYREVPGRGKVAYWVLKSEDDSVYFLVSSNRAGFGKNFVNALDATVVATGRETLPLKDYPLKFGEITFDVQELYKEDLVPIN